MAMDPETGLGRPDTLGVIGGMGPLATVDFLDKLVKLTPAETDPEHIPVIVSCQPQIPSRPKHYLAPDEYPTPLPALLARRDMLLAAGARAFAIPCNTAHYWAGDLQLDCPAPVLHIVEATRMALVRRGLAKGRLALIATEATLAGRLYQDPLEEAGYEVVPASDALTAKYVRPAINAVKAGRAAEGGEMLLDAVADLRTGGADAILLGCTEVPAGLGALGPDLPEDCLDPTEALAQAAVDWAMGVRAGVAAAEAAE